MESTAAVESATTPATPEEASTCSAEYERETLTTNKSQAEPKKELELESELPCSTEFGAALVVDETETTLVVGGVETTSVLDDTEETLVLDGTEVTSGTMLQSDCESSLGTKMLSNKKEKGSSTTDLEQTKHLSKPAASSVAKVKKSKKKDKTAGLIEATGTTKDEIAEGNEGSGNRAIGVSVDQTLTKHEGTESQSAPESITLDNFKDAVAVAAEDDPYENSLDFTAMSTDKDATNKNDTKDENIFVDRNLRSTVEDKVIADSDMIVDSTSTVATKTPKMLSKMSPSASHETSSMLVCTADTHVQSLTTSNAKNTATLSLAEVWSQPIQPLLHAVQQSSSTMTDAICKVENSPSKNKDTVQKTVHKDLENDDPSLTVVNFDVNETIDCTSSIEMNEIGFGATKKSKRAFFIKRSQESSTINSTNVDDAETLDGIGFFSQKNHTISKNNNSADKDVVYDATEDKIPNKDDAVSLFNIFNSPDFNSTSNSEPFDQKRVLRNNTVNQPQNTNKAIASAASFSDTKSLSHFDPFTHSDVQNNSEAGVESNSKKDKKNKSKAAEENTKSDEITKNNLEFDEKAVKPDLAAKDQDEFKNVFTDTTGVDTVDNATNFSFDLTANPADNLLDAFRLDSTESWANSKAKLSSAKNMDKSSESFRDIGVFSADQRDIFAWWTPESIKAMFSKINKDYVDA